jgi:transcription elongation factor Elf1
MTAAITTSRHRSALPAVPLHVAPEPLEEDRAAMGPADLVDLVALPCVRASFAGDPCPECGATVHVHVATPGGRTTDTCRRCGYFHGWAAEDGPQDVPDAPALDFSGWTLRPDATGRLGWEAPDLAEGDRWWATATFEDAPVAPSAEHARAPRVRSGLPAERAGCPRCGSGETVDVDAGHGTIRRDCRRCGRFIRWARWRGRAVE